MCSLYSVYKIEMSFLSLGIHVLYLKLLKGYQLCFVTVGKQEILLTDVFVIK
jgi:hypothetical protein